MNTDQTLPESRPESPVTQAAQLHTELKSMTEEVGICGCALLNASTGLLWCATGQLENTPLIAEAACDYWRLYLRNREYFQDLGEIRAQILVHSQQRLTILGCGPDLLLVSLSDEKKVVDWKAWQTRVRNFQTIVLSS